MSAGSKDFLSPEKRSQLMSKIRSTDTKAEKIVFKFLRQENIYFQKYYKKVPGKPDIALPRKKRAVFIDGDFWHGRTYDHVTKNRSKDDYWVVKIAKNMARDIQHEEILAINGWKVIRIWEEDILRKSTQLETLVTIKKFLTNI